MKETKRYNPNSFNAVHAAVVYLAFWLMMFVTAFLFSAVLDSRRNFEVSDYSPYLVLESVLIAAGMGLVALIMCLSANVRPVNGGGFLARKGCGMEILMAFVLIGGLLAVFMPLSSSFGTEIRNIQFSLGFPSASGGDVPIAPSFWAYVYIFICTPLLPAIFEELLFRGVILRGLLQFGKVPAVILSGFLFALAHGSFEQFIYQFLTGMIFGVLVLETKNLVLGMAAHFANNFFAVVFSLVLSGVEVSAEGRPHAEVYSSIAMIMIYAVGTVCLIAGIVYFGKRMLHSQRIPDHSCGNVRASFVVNDMVSGTLVEEKSWYDCGGLEESDGEQKCFLVGKKGRSKINRKAKMGLSILLLAIGFAIALAMSLVSLIGFAT